MTSPVSIPAGHELVAADFDAYENLTGTWQDFSSSLAWTAATTNPVLGNGTKNARFMRAGRLVVYQGRIVMGSTTTFGTGAWAISLPATAVGGAAGANGGGLLFDSSAVSNSRPATSELLTTSTIRFYATTGRVDATNPFTWATSDEFSWYLTYEAA